MKPSKTPPGLAWPTTQPASSSTTGSHCKLATQMQKERQPPPFLDMSRYSTSLPVQETPTSQQLQHYLDALEQKDRELIDSLKRHKESLHGLSLQTHKQAKFHSVSFTNPYWQEMLQHRHEEEMHRLLSGGMHRQASKSSSSEEEGARQTPPPAPQQPEYQALPQEGTIELLLHQMQQDREASNRNMESLVQALASNQLKKSKMDAIAQCPQMHYKEDVVEYLQMFEEIQIAWGNPKENWTHSLIPLLNKNCKAVVLGLPSSTKYNYKLFKAELLATASHKHRQSSKGSMKRNLAQPGERWPML